MNILHLVLGCKNKKYYDIDLAAKNTWKQKSPDNIKTIFMYGDSSNTYWDNDDSFYVNRVESLDLCLYKTISAFETFFDSNFDYIFRTNCTGYFDLELVKKFLEGKPTKNFYCGCVGNINEINFASGSGYFISKDIVEKIIYNKSILYNYNLPGWFDDVSVGKFITQYLKIEIDNSAKRLDLYPEDINDNLDMSHYHYRILNKGNVESLYKINNLKLKLKDLQ